ncbi:hypothetical protein V8G54_007958 [Vigna mungo]|uniref:Uncharacterized protein n=1 Tax=Vigna mungo TaxID=3915 RepID=A0AAQ3P275_VIGMU
MEEKPSASSSISASASASSTSESSSSVPWTLRDQLPIKLEGLSNLVAWKEQVERVLISENLTRFVTNPVPPIKYASEVCRTVNLITEEYRHWVVQDQTVRMWLLSSLSEFMCSFVMGWEHAWEVWSGVHELCRSELVSKIKIALRKEMKNTKKGNQTVKDYVNSITYFIDTLIVLGDDVTEREHIDAILDGLPEKYESLRTIIHAREDATVSDLESLMTIQETVLNTLAIELPLDALLPDGSLHLVTEGHLDSDNVDAEGRGSGGGQGGGRGRRRSGRRRVGGQGSGGHRGSN